MEKIKYIASVSFGKDSLAMLKIIKDKNLPLDEIVFCDIQANKNTSGLFPEQKEFINKMIPIIEEYMQVPIKIISSEKTFEDFFYMKKGNKSKYPNSIYGFPLTIKAWCNDRLKMMPIKKYFKTQGNHYTYLGIAYDEPERYARLKDNEIAPLYDYKITEEEAFKICEKLNWISPIYDNFKRDGCWFCPKQNLNSLKTLYIKYPQYWEILKRWQSDSPIPFKYNKTIFDLEERFKKEILKEKDGK